MTNDETITKLECPKEISFLLPNFRLRHSFVLRHSGFVIPIIRASLFPHMLAHHLFLIGARAGLFRADQAAVIKID